MLGCDAQCIPGCGAQCAPVVPDATSGGLQESSRAQEPSLAEVEALRAELELLRQTLQDVTQVS